MKKDLVKPIYSSFLSCEKDFETILKKLFFDDRKRADILKRLLIINTPDCLDNETSPVYTAAINKSVKQMKDEGYIRIVPKIEFSEHEEVKSYILISFDNFTPNEENPEFRDCTVHIDILCHTDCWDIGNFRIRPLKIAGYIDGLLNESKLSGIGTLNFLGCNELVLSSDLSGYSLMYRAVHGSDDIIPVNV
jgi:hypothetical protein